MTNDLRGRLFESAVQHGAAPPRKIWLCYLAPSPREIDGKPHIRAVCTTMKQLHDLLHLPGMLKDEEVERLSIEEYEHGRTVKP